MSTTSTPVPAQPHFQVGETFLLDSCLHVCLHPSCDSLLIIVDLLVAFSGCNTGFAAGSICVWVCVCACACVRKGTKSHFDLVIYVLLKLQVF